MTTTADSKKRIVLPTARPGDVFDVQCQGEGRFMLVCLARPEPKARLTKEQCLRAIDAAPLHPKMDWGKLRGVDARTMMLLDTNVLIYASDERMELCCWARRMIAEGVSGEGAAVNAVSLAEVCVGDAEPHTVADRIRSWGVAVLDIPAAASEVCARAYQVYRMRRKAGSGKDAPAVPLPDFFIGAHAQVMSWTLVTADDDRFKTYFPAVSLKSP